ncbi:zinc finger domain-containing protein [uncultured Methanofollis sp.]|uniref:zinc finger domain-containing protein n=1 Tax=uncultured Methanofollis sp. TaxID=262500 RepID=UPI00261B0651|nr:zinc finger domain-containing protein [uncultured Methanofollis sp.]
MAMEKCTSCKAPLSECGATRFNCPVCGNEIRRCAQCREQSITYTCEKCGYQGP